MNPAAVDDPDSCAMARMAAGEESALSELMERYGQRLFHYLIRLLHDENLATDLVQEVFVRVWENRARFHAGRRFTPWLYAIATNLCRDHWRRELRHPKVSLEAEASAAGPAFEARLIGVKPSPDQTLQLAERAEAVRRAVAALPDELRTPLILFEYEDLSQAEIAETLKCSPKAVEMRLYRARQELRESLRPLLDSTE